MNAEDLQPRDLLHIGPACGVPHQFRPIDFVLITVLQPKDSHRLTGMSWLAGYEVDRDTPSQDWARREIYVITDGIKLLHRPPPQPYARRAVNARAAIPRPRRPAETPTPGRTR